MAATPKREVNVNEVAIVALHTLHVIIDGAEKVLPPGSKALLAVEVVDDLVQLGAAVLEGQAPAQPEPSASVESKPIGD